MAEFYRIAQGRGLCCCVTGPVVDGDRVVLLRDFEKRQILALVWVLCCSFGRRP